MKEVTLNDEQIVIRVHFLIHSADPQSRSVVITIFTYVVRPSVGPHFSK